MLSAICKSCKNSVLANEPCPHCGKVNEGQSLLDSGVFAIVQGRQRSEQPSRLAVDRAAIRTERPTALGRYMLALLLAVIPGPVLANEAVTPVVATTAVAEVQIAELMPTTPEPVVIPEVAAKPVVIPEPDPVIEAVQPLAPAPSAPHEVRLESLQWASEAGLVEVLLAKVRCEVDLSKGLLEDQAALRAHARLEALTKILEIRARGLEFCASDTARIRALHEVISEKARQGLVGSVTLETEGAEWSPIGVLYFYAQPGVKVDAKTMRALVELFGQAGVELAIPVKPGTGWLGTQLRGEPAY